MSWGVENLTKEERFARAINAGVDQIGGTDESEVVVAAVHSGMLSEARVREAASRILIQKFQLGLFEQPYVDEQAAVRIAGNATFVAEGQAAQSRAVVLLENKSPKATGKPLLPVAPAGKKAFLLGIDAAQATAAGFVVVDSPEKANIAIIRAPAPFQGEHPGYFFGSRQHEGRLNFAESDEAYAALVRASTVVPTVFITTLERPLILTNVKPHATALLGDFGIADAPLLSLITGKAQPSGHLPFELPSSAEAVRQQKSDLPHDSANPLYPFGFGLHY
jgi:beta-glucosidase